MPGNFSITAKDAFATKVTLTLTPIGGMFAGDAKLRKLSREEFREITLKSERRRLFYVLWEDLTPAEIEEART